MTSLGLLMLLGAVSAALPLEGRLEVDRAEVLRMGDLMQKLDGAIGQDDGASAFVAAMRRLPGRVEIEPLFSPLRMPRYNGACEAGIGGAKRRTEYLAIRHNRPLDWKCDDLHAAQLWAKETIISPASPPKRPQAASRIPRP